MHHKKTVEMISWGSRSEASLTPVTVQLDHCDWETENGIPVNAGRFLCATFIYKWRGYYMFYCKRFEWYDRGLDWPYPCHCPSREF